MPPLYHATDPSDPWVWFWWRFATAQAVRHVQHLVFDINIRLSILNAFLRSALDLLPIRRYGYNATRNRESIRPSIMQILAVILHGLTSTGSNVYHTGFFEAFYSPQSPPSRRLPPTAALTCTAACLGTFIDGTIPIN